MHLENLNRKHTALSLEYSWNEVEDLINKDRELIDKVLDKTDSLIETLNENRFVLWFNENPTPYLLGPPEFTREDRQMWIEKVAAIRRVEPELTQEFVMEHALTFVAGMMEKAGEGKALSELEWDSVHRMLDLALSFYPEMYAVWSINDADDLTIFPWFRGTLNGIIQANN